MDQAAALCLYAKDIGDMSAAVEPHPDSGR